MGVFPAASGNFLPESWRVLMKKEVGGRVGRRVWRGGEVGGGGEWEEGAWDKGLGGRRRDKEVGRRDKTIV